jgi:hypothetical protein
MHPVFDRGSDGNEVKFEGEASRDVHIRNASRHKRIVVVKNTSFMVN